MLDVALREIVDALVVHVITWTTISTTGNAALASPPSALTRAALNRLRVVAKARGYKVVMRLLPHGVEYLEPVLAYLEHYAAVAAANSGNSAKNR